MIPAPETQDPNIITKFELPPEQIIPNCTYAGGATFPDNCTDDEDNLIFEAGREPQSTLDAIKARYGITGEYNVVPPGYKAKTPYDDEIDRLQLGTPE